MKEEQKIPTTLKEQIQSFHADLKKYIKSSFILRNNNVVLICEKCNEIYPPGNGIKCNACGGYTKMFRSSEIEISIPSRKQKKEQIMELNKKIREENELLEQQENNCIKNKFSNILDEINQYNSKEILGFIIELQKLDKYYESIPENKQYLLNNLVSTKKYKLDQMLNKKFDEIRNSIDNVELCKSYLEELNYCKSRFKEYSTIFNTTIIKLENYLEDIQNNKFIKKTELSTLEEIDNLNGLEFENYISHLLKINGYKEIEITPASGDFGIDILAKKDDIKYGIQCKNYSSQVGSESIQEAYSGKQYYNCHVGVVVTNNYFTKHAKQLAEKNGIILWDREKLKEMMK